jgi:8-oxo-dGTP pyrophosphatase MutT (NUDIX family)
MPFKRDGSTVQQSGVLPIFENGVVLVTSRTKKRWTIPKGFIETGMTPCESAANEAFEEAGAIGSVSDLEIGSYEYSKWGKICRVGVFEMQVTDLLGEWLESHQRERIIVPPAEAAELLWHPVLSGVVKEFYCHV